jgi:hypothetical protein
MPIDSEKQAQRVPAKLPEKRLPSGVDGQEIAAQAYLRRVLRHGEQKAVTTCISC